MLLKPIPSYKISSSGFDLKSQFLNLSTPELTLDGEKVKQGSSRN